MKIGAGSSVLQMEERAMKHYQFLRSAYGLLILVFVISGLTLVGCSSTESRLVGKWKEKGGTEVLEFFKDGRVSITDKGESITGSWTALDDGRIRIEVSVLGTTYVMMGTIKGATLRVEMADKSAEYERSS
jgi:hypothetical protein